MASMRLLLALVLASMASICHAGPVCVVPSKPGGAMDLTCKLAQKGMALTHHGLDISFMPGGIGAVAWTTMATQRRNDAQSVVAFSGGSLLNLAQGKFGRFGVDDVRWVAALGADYGMIAVRADSAYHSLAELLTALRTRPAQVLIGVSGTVGSQDWLKMALLARMAGIDPKQLRFVALDGGGEAFTALHAGVVQVVSGDASEAKLYAEADKTRVLAVLSDQRLAGALAAVPTAREQGYALVWPIIRGVWIGKDVPDADYQRWSANFNAMLNQPGFAKLREEFGLYPFSLTGPALSVHIKKAVEDYRQLAHEFKLVR